MRIVIQRDEIKYNQPEETKYINPGSFYIFLYYLRTLFITAIAIFIITSAIRFRISHQCRKILLLRFFPVMNIKPPCQISGFIIIEKAKPVGRRFYSIYLCRYLHGQMLIGSAIIPVQYMVTAGTRLQYICSLLAFLCITKIRFLFINNYRILGLYARQ